MKSARSSVSSVKNQAGRPKDATKRENIVRAANDLFLKHGYTLTSMEAVAKKADVSKLTIYSHFANKDELFKEMVRQRCDKLATPQNFLSYASQPVEKALLALGLHMTALIFRPDSIRLHCMMQAEAVRHPQLAQIFYEAGPNRVRAAFGELLKHWVAQGKLMVPDTAKATEQFFSLLKGEVLNRIILLRMPAPGEKERQAHVESVVAFFLAAYKPSRK